MPAPKTTQVEPRSTLAVLSAAPIPVESPQAKSAARSSGASAVDLRECDLRHDRVLREGRGAHEVADRLAVPEEARRAVGKEALVLLVTNRQTEVRARAAAVDALAALGREERDDVVAGLDSETPSPTASTTPAPSWPSTVGA